MEAVILAGGMGTRLGTLAKGYPKVMMPVAGKPFLEYLLRYLQEYAITEIVLCVGYCADAVEEYFEDGARFGLHIVYSHERELRGTGGAIKLAEPLLHGDRFFVLNGDVFTHVDYRALAAYHQARAACATLTLLEMADARRYGSVEIDAQQQITRFAEKDPSRRQGLINAGVYLFQREILAAIAPDTPVSVERELFPALVGNGLLGYVSGGYFIDIGLPETYAQLNADPTPLYQYAHPGGG